MGTFKSNLSITSPTVEHFNGSKDFILADECSDEISIKSVSNCFERCAKNVFRKKTLYKRLPILNWLPKYSLADAIGDLIAGFTVGLTVIPQGLAYAGVAGLPIEFGLYGSFMGCFVYVLLGSCKDITVGSTAICSLLIFQIAHGVWQRAILLTFITGIIEIAMAIFQLGFLVEFVSGPVSAGFTSAVALIIFTSQVKNILGIKTTGASFLDMWISIFGQLDQIKIHDTILGVSCIIFLITMRFFANIRIGPKDDKQKSICHKIVNKAIWLLGTSRNALAVFICGAIGAYLHSIGMGNYIKLTGFIPPGLPEFKLPPFSIEPTIISRSSNDSSVSEVFQQTEGETFIEMITNLGSGIIVVPLIAMLETIAVCKAFAKGQPVDATQEIFATGVANVVNSLVQGYRANGGLARSAVNNASGVRTPLANFYIGSIVVFALIYLTPYFSYIPNATLAAIIISAVIFMTQHRVIIPMWRSKRTDLIPGLAAFIACLVLPLQIGILIGMGLNIIFILYHAARPKFTLETLQTSTGIRYLMLTPDRCLIFPSVEFVRNVINKQGRKSTLPVVVDCTHIYGADFTAAKVINSMITEFNERNQIICFYNLKPSVVRIFEGVGSSFIVFYNMQALEDHLGGDETDIIANNDIVP